MRTPSLSELKSRLRQIPPEIAPARLERLPQPGITLEAVCHDLWRDLFGKPISAAYTRRLAAIYLDGQDDRSRLGALLLALWLLQAPALRPLLRRGPLEAMLLTDYPALLEALDPASLFHEPERQEELARFWLRALGIQPLDESPADSAERWEMLSSQRRRELFAQLRLRRRREQAVRAAEARRRVDW